MSCRKPRPWWRGLLLASNLTLPIPTLLLLISGTAGGSLLLSATLLAHGLLLWAIMAPRCQWLGLVIHHFPTAEKEVWLTIDDGPVGDATQALSSALRERGVRATFFVIGTRLQAHPGIAAILQRDGHSLANHSASHRRKSFWCSPRHLTKREVDGGISALHEVGAGSPWFRPPVGHKTPGSTRFLRALARAMASIMPAR